MRVIGGLMGAMGGLALMYFGVHQILGKLPYPFATENAAKLGSGLSAILACLGMLLISRSRKKPSADAASETSEPKLNP